MVVDKLYFVDLQVVACTAARRGVGGEGCQKILRGRLCLVVGELGRKLGPLRSDRHEGCGLTDAIASLLCQFGVAIIHVAVVQNELAAAIRTAAAHKLGIERDGIGTASKEQAVRGVAALGIVVVAGTGGCGAAHVDHARGEVAVSLGTQNAL